MLSSDGISLEKLKRCIGGYSGQSVRNFVRDVKLSCQNLEKENKRLFDELSELEKKLSVYKQNENLIKTALVNAQKSADMSIREAKRSAEVILEEAQRKSDDILYRAKANTRKQEKIFKELKNETSNFRSRLLDAYKNHIKLIGAIPSETDDKIVVAVTRDNVLHEQVSDEKEKETSRRIVRIVEKKSDETSRVKPIVQVKDIRISRVQDQEKKCLEEEKIKQKDAELKDVEKVKIKKEEIDKKSEVEKFSKQRRSRGFVGKKYKIKSLDKFSNLKFGDAYEALNS
ncbi:MAG: DivIVA domain-containing protein [Oscillospiraceae bacterium]|nr:DivIVA domain-containing protein [Oscillospiraceae bacterium]